MVIEERERTALEDRRAPKVELRHKEARCTDGWITDDDATNAMVREEWVLELNSECVG